MSWIPTLALAFALAMLAAGTGLLLRRAGRARHEISLRLHETALGLDRRCDVMQDEIRALEVRQQIAYLFDLVDCGEAEGKLPPTAAARLRRHALELHAESFD